jgi:RimJ/RimL family protein N-acetyltransferase
VQQGDHLNWSPQAGEQLFLSIPISFPSQEEAQHFEEGFRQYQQFDLGNWAIIRKQDGCLLGWCGLRFDKEHNQTCVGFRLAPAYWQQGYTAEAADACLKFAFTNAGLSNIYATVTARNKGAIKVLKALGLKMQRTPNDVGSHLAAEEIYTITKEEWLSLQ